MSENKLTIAVSTADKDIELILFGENGGETLFEISDAEENGEARFQIIEGCFYEYKITDGYCLKIPHKESSDILSQSKFNPSSGRIAPNIYVGTLSIDVLNKEKEKCGEVKLEVQSVKTTYREDYRYMLEELTEKCHDLLLQYNSPVSQLFEPDYFKDPVTAYQRFAFMKSILDSIEFNDSVHKIISAPVTRWKESETIKDIRGVKRFNNSALRQLTSVSNRIFLPDDHPVKNMLTSIPSKIRVNNKTETVDTPENRFVKHALVSFLSFCSDFYTKISDKGRNKHEAGLLADKIEHYLSHSLFKEISTPTTLPLNSPVLQRKEGYREMLRVWLMFNVAAKIVWQGGEDVYSGNKRDVAVLYEYWLFFKLLDVIKEVFKIEPKSINELIKETEDGLGLQLKQGRHLPVRGIYENGTRQLWIEFSYNKTFSGNSEYPEGGSWTKNMKPDYTLSIWPYGIDMEIAEKEELIVHVHFDAKYKVDKLAEILGDEKEFDNEKTEQKKGTYKRADLLKMHAYKDAIRRTAGAYVLYPGTEGRYTKTGFHEVIPGLGAFAIRPSKTRSGLEELKEFLNELVTHFMNRASHREKISLKTYETYKDGNSNELNEALPETYGINRSLIPDETYVLVAYYKSSEHLKWIKENKLYNARTEDDRGSLKLGPGEVGAKYLLLHTKGEIITSKLMKITESGPRVFSKQTMIKKGYPSDRPRDFYLVYKVEEVTDKEFLLKNWDITKLTGYLSRNNSALPFSVTLTELMRAVHK